MSVLTREALKEILSRHYEGDAQADFFDEIQRIPRNVHGMRLDRIKKILKEIKPFPGHGHLSLYQNKSQLADSLTKIIVSVLTPMNPSTRPPAPAVVAPRPPAPSPVGGVRAAETERKISLQAPLSAMKRDMGGNPVSKLSTSTPSTSASSAAHILCTPKRKEIFHQLSVMSGISKQEILREMQECPESQLSRDNLLLRIMSRKDPHGLSFINFTPNDALLKQQEDAELDRAILESEQERDNIQMRKKRRAEELKNNLQVELISSEEFNRSVLLHGISSSPSSSTTSSHNHACFGGSKVLRILCSLFEYLANSLDPVELVNLHSSEFCSLRTSAAKLLIIEADALKYYADAAKPYLLRMCQILDQASPSLCHSSISSKVSPESVKQVDLFFRANQSFVESVLISEAEKLQKGLCRIPSDGAMVPDIFRRKSLLPFIDLLRKPIDEDGFELVDVAGAMKLLSDVEDDVDDASDDSDDDI